MSREAPRDLPRVPVPEMIREVYLIGIGGTGMGSLAGLLAAAGYSVRGSDEKLYPPMSDQLEALGIPVCEGFSADNLEPAPDLVIVGNVCRPENPEAVALWRRGLPFLSMPEALDRLFLEGRRSAVVAGTHGKTTTTAMLAHLLTASGRDPSFLVGGVLNGFDTTYHLGQGADFAIEGDEYDSAFFDKGPKFLHYAPDVAAITSLEFDHADIYDDVEQIAERFTRFAALLPEDGALYVWSGAERGLAAARDARCRVLSYGLGDGDDLAARVLDSGADGTRFEVRRGGGAVAEARLVLGGEYNVLNALAALGLAEALDLSLEEAAPLLASFEGVKRRQELVGEVDGIIVIDDFAHHPTAVRETIAAVRATRLSGAGRLWALYEPRSNTARRSVHQRAYAEAFDGAELVRLARPFNPHGLPADELLDVDRLVWDLGKRGLDAAAHDTVEAIVADVSSRVQPGDVLLVMSNGGFDGIHDKLIAALERQPSG